VFKEVDDSPRGTNQTLETMPGKTRLPSMGTGTNIVMESCADSAFVAHSTLWQLQAKRRNRKAASLPSSANSAKELILLRIDN
jgi:hypothetical protein